MTDDVKQAKTEESDTADVDLTDNRCLTDFTQVASVARGGEYVPCMDRRRQSLRAKLEREKFERKKQILANPFIVKFRNLFGTSRQ